jgi:phage tail sheath protein FI
MFKHGVYTGEIPTAIATPVVATSGIPFVIGTAPVQSAENPVSVGVPVLCFSWAEAVEKIGYSDDWGKYTLSEFMYSQFKLFGAAPVIFCNLLDPGADKATVPAADVPVVDHKAALPFDTINDATLVVKSDSEVLMVKDVDYIVFYDTENCYVEVLSTSTHYGSSQLNIAYTKVTPASVTASDVAIGIENIEQCMARTGIVPDLICAPGFSNDPAVAAVMAAKAATLNGLFEAKALIDLDSTDYSEVISDKNNGNYTDLNQILCWPMVSLGERRFHLSTQLAGLISALDTLNDGVPYESPSNKSLKCDSSGILDGNVWTEIFLTHAQANYLNSGGVVTALNFVGGWKAWGNYTACYPVNTDVKDYFVPISRMFGWVGHTLINTFWSRVDSPMTPRLVGTILDTCNIWLNGLVGAGYLLGARAVMLESENPVTSLMAGIIKIHIYITPPSPAQEIDFMLEYDASYVSALFS